MKKRINKMCLWILKQVSYACVKMQTFHAKRAQAHTAKVEEYKELADRSQKLISEIKE